MEEDLLAGDVPREERDNLFAWTVFILLLIGFALACWLGTFYVFGHPENPRSYKLLQKLKKIDAPKRFEVTAAPPGEFLAARKLYDKYIAFTRIQLQNENAELLRTYINNYQETKRLVPYIIGRYTILSSRALKPTDVVTSGVVAVGQAVDYPSVLVEYIYPCEAIVVPKIQKMITPGTTVELKRTVDLSAILHIERVEGRLQFTVVPLLYGTYALKQGQGTFSLQPPPDLNMPAGMPVVKTTEMQEALRSFAGRETPAQRLASSGGAAPSSSPGAAEELVRVESGPPPGVNVAIAAPVSTPAVHLASKGGAPPPPPPPVPVPTPAPEEAATPAPVEVVMDTTPIPMPAAETPAPIAASTPKPVLSPDGVPLQPFLVSKTAPPVTTLEGANWRTYAPGQMPRGRLVDTDELPAIADRTVGGERLYIRGQFTVTASEENRAVLRMRGSISTALTHLVNKGGGSPRIIVEFPAGALPPAEGSSVTRDESRPFQITDVRRGADGEINVYAREVTLSP